ncbi:gamma-sarcoglycan isoform X1 [Tribolium castaneum]|uniref:Gamma-sarcoglycan-like Protein n=2 Tax=Tribolium castaneum TaxID=7070 RepID=A0A139WJ89_TRICA|nr:PREDICTED: gamma-sarcoglycan isoform X1 [Tribolium castaneum]KYB27911.1 Gamma-sarcoglycan-like Protein [Tribolium castaneum]|eukprot:XP_015834995.1 PREDICTED: gamma-sarcoglycan isoform X1 [Tribolium castaneum]
MPGEEELHLNGVGRTQIYQPSTGEKHVLFYPTSPAPSVNSDERRSWSQASSSLATQTRSNHRNSNNNADTGARMKTSEAAPQPDAGAHPSDPNDGFRARYNFRIGIYGWRKRCLYILILVLLVMVIVNLALTLWVLKVMEFSSEGMGQLKIVSGGLRLEGKAFVLDTLIASSIKSRTGQPIIVESSRNLTLASRSKNGLLSNMIFLGDDRFECLTSTFKVMDDRGVVLFAADPREVVVGAESLRVTGEGGASFSGSVQTTLVRAEPGNDLRLESPTRSLEIHGPQGVHMESRGGKMKIVSLNDISFKSEVGSIHLDASSILMPMLPTAIPTSKPAPNKNQIFQVCVCNNGRLFLVPSHLHCAAEEDDRICR